MVRSVTTKQRQNGLARTVMLGIAILLTVVQTASPALGDDGWDWVLTSEGWAYNSSNPAHPVFGDGRLITDIKQRELCEVTGKVLINPHRMVTDFSEPIPPAISREFLRPPDDYRLIWGIFADQKSQTGLTGVVGWEHRDKLRALGHPNLAPNLPALAAGNIEVKEGPDLRIWFNNASGRVSAYPDQSFSRLYLAHRLFKDNAELDAQFYKPDFVRVSGYGRSNEGASPYVSENAKDVMKSVTEVIRTRKPLPCPPSPRPATPIMKVLRGILSGS